MLHGSRSNAWTAAERVKTIEKVMDSLKYLFCSIAVQSSMDANFLGCSSTVQPLLKELKLPKSFGNGDNVDEMREREQNRDYE